MKKEYKNADHRKQRGRTAPNRALKFVVQIRKSPSESEGWMNFSLSLEKTIDDVTYDEVYDEADRVFLTNINEKYYPMATFRIMVEDDYGEWYPVVAESDEEEMQKLKDTHEYKKWLVLPEATYHLTKECELWMKLKDEGILSEDDEFDYDKMHRILEEMKK